MSDRKITRGPVCLSRGDANSHLFEDRIVNDVGITLAFVDAGGDADLFVSAHNIATGLYDLGYDPFVVLERLPEIIEALRHYANPEIYKPHPHGLAFDDRDSSGRAKDILSAFTSGGGDASN